MSTIFGENIHSYVKKWEEVERTRFQGFDVGSWAKDCFDSTFVMHYKTEDKTVDNRGVIHFTKDGCIILNGTIYSGAQCLNVIYEAYTGNKLNSAGEAEKFMMAHADDPHLAFVYFHIYPYNDVVGYQVSNSMSIGTGIFITSGSSATGGKFYQHYFWNGTHYYRVVAAEASNASAWIEIQDISSIRYNESEHRIELKGIKNLSTAVSNANGFVGNTASSVEIPIVDSSNTAGLLSSIAYNAINNDISLNKTNIEKHNTRLTTIENKLPDLTDKVNKAVDRAIYNFDNIVTVAPNTIKPLSELLNYNGKDSTIKAWLNNSIENCELNWYTTEKRFLLNLGEYQFPVTENIINDTNPDWDIKGQWYSMYGKPMIYGNTDNYQYNLYRKTEGFNDQSKNWRNGADNIYVICSEGGNTNNNLESLSYILLTETGVQSQLDWLTEKVTSKPVTSAPVDLSNYLKKSDFNTYANNWDSSKGITSKLTQVNTYFWDNNGNAYIPNIIVNFGSYVSKQELVNQSYVTKAYLKARNYADNDTVKNALYNYYQSLKLEISDVNNTVNKNTNNISDLQTNYNNLKNSFDKLSVSYNTLYNTVSYTISYHTSLFNYLIGLHSGDSPVTPAPVTPAPVTPAPVTPAPVTSMTMKLYNLNNKNVLWDDSYLAECVNVALNDESNVIGSTYYSNDIVIPCQFNSVSYSFDMILYSNIIGGITTNEFKERIYNDNGAKLIWTGNSHTTMTAPLNEYETINIKDYPYTVKGAFGSTLDAYLNTANGYNYYIYGKYNTTTVPGVGSAYYTAQFKYIYPYLVCLGDYDVSYFEIPNDYVINDTTEKPRPTVTGSNYYNLTNDSDIKVKYINSWVHDNKYFTKYNVNINKNAAKKFNNGEYRLKVGLHTCSPQVFRTDNKDFNGSVL